LAAADHVVLATVVTHQLLVSSLYVSLFHNSHRNLKMRVAFSPLWSSVFTSTASRAKQLTLRKVTSSGKNSPLAAGNGL
jgi:hypothetical protein